MNNETHRYLIELYPVSPNEWFHVYNIDNILNNTPRAIDEAYDRFNLYLFAVRRRYNKDYVENQIIYYNNSSWAVVEADSVRTAVNKFWDLFSRKCQHLL